MAARSLGRGTSGPSRHQKKKRG